MNVTKNKDFITETYSIPADVMVEIAQVILQADLPHEIISVKESKGQIIFSISHQSNLKFHLKAIKNITDIIEEYQTICSNDEETTDWRD